MTLAQLRFVKAILLTKSDQNQAALRVLAECEQAWSHRDPVFISSPPPPSLFASSSFTPSSLRSPPSNQLVIIQTLIIKPACQNQETIRSGQKRSYPSFFTLPPSPLFYHLSLPPSPLFNHLFPLLYNEDIEEAAKKEKDIQFTTEYNKRLQQAVATMKESERSLRERLEKADRDSILVLPFLSLSFFCFSEVR